MEYCKRGHPWKTKTTRWIKVRGTLWRKCRICEAAAFRLKYNTNAEFRKSKQAYNLKYYKEKVANHNAV